MSRDSANCRIVGILPQQSMFAAFETAPSENPHSCRQKGESAVYEYDSCPLSPPEATVESLISIFIVYT